MLALAAPWSDSGGLSLGHGTVLQAAIAGGADVLPARIGGGLMITRAVTARLDLSLSLAGGAVTTIITTFVPTLAVRYGVWQSEQQGITLRLSAALPVSLLVANEVSASGTRSHAQARLEGVPLELLAAYSYALGTYVELGGLLPVRVFPAVTGELSYGVGLGARMGVHFLQRFIIAAEATARLEHTTYAPTGLGVGNGLFVIPAGQLSFSLDFQ